MDLNFMGIFDDAKYEIIDSFLKYERGFLTDEDLARNLNCSHNNAFMEIRSNGISDETKEALTSLRELFGCEYVGYENVESLRAFYIENTDENVIKAMRNYSEDKQKAKEMLLEAAQRGDFYAKRFVKKKGWESF